MTNGAAYVDAQPSLIPARISIHHLQLRDLLQPAAQPDRVLFVNRLKIEQADFNSLKPPTTYCTLDFLPNCLTTSCGLLAAGGQHSELALRPLHSPSYTPHHQVDPDADRYPAPWLLRTPTGGSINNAISIQPDSYGQPSSSAYSAPHSSSRRRRERIRVTPHDPSTSSSSSSATIWARDEPRSSSSSYPSPSSSSLSQRYPLTHSAGPPSWQIPECSDHDDDTAAAYGFDPSTTASYSSGALSSSPWRSSTWRRPHNSTLRANLEAERRHAASEVAAHAGPVRIMVSNNDQSIKSYKLRPPSGSPGAGGRIESGLPGLSKTSTLHFPTAINHSSLSPDRRTLVAVGDTPEVFIYHVRPNGEYDKVATYSASTDASFSTTWSPDGSKFAVASQDGIVSVWDVRSSYPLASLTTSQAGMPGGNGAARVVKFSPGGDLLAFTEHRNYFHIADTVTFANVQRLPAPHATPGAASLSPLVPTSISALDSAHHDDGGYSDMPSPPRRGAMAAPNMGLLTNPMSVSASGSSSSSSASPSTSGPNRMQILLNAAQAHREATTVLDRFRITSSIRPGTEV
ncbi:uncharacterized protein PFL1_05128 [Pseudozyma flocculosa PF-1]|uniref:DUF2415 domain-containing protein n=1 Tax=Pseudozyma flocculosa PF-1 TaxID=1277687 RepID=A0A061H5D9_9BASI|nr:uncharacterized protein PFL1_05128 [Pseudozyma flocculosa PF-1]EPQ27205.1 hypothetical protein PFL1_05128 [Pseudozyma flocculosa PF-1]